MKKDIRECVHCGDEYDFRQTNGYGSCKVCADFYKQHEPFKTWKQLRNLGEKNYFSY